jgi:hypothetical protein
MGSKGIQGASIGGRVERLTHPDVGLRLGAVIGGWEVLCADDTEDTVTLVELRLRLGVGMGSKGIQGASIGGRVERLTHPDVGLRLGAVMGGWEMLCVDDTEDTVTLVELRLRLAVGMGSKGIQGASIGGRVERLTDPDVGLRLGAVMGGWEVLCADDTGDTVTLVDLRLRLAVGMGSKGIQGASIGGRVERLTGPDVGLRLGAVIRGSEIVFADGPGRSVTFVGFRARLIVGTGSTGIQGPSIG